MFSVFWFKLSSYHSIELYQAPVSRAHYPGYMMSNKYGVSSHVTTAELSSFCLRNVPGYYGKHVRFRDF